jgi:hypothetical protein
MPDTITNGAKEQAVLSAGISRKLIADLTFEDIGPSDAVAKFIYRSNFKASRKSGAFQSIIPLTVAEISHLSVESMRFSHLVTGITVMRDELRLRTAALTPITSDSETNNAI